MTLQPSGPALCAYEVTKVYRVGEVEVHAPPLGRPRRLWS